MKKIFSWLLFLVFLGLCGTELYFKLFNEFNSASSGIITKEREIRESYEQTTIY